MKLFPRSQKKVSSSKRRGRFQKTYPSSFKSSSFPFVFSLPIFPLFLFYKRKPPQAKRGRFSELCTLIKICRQSYLFPARFFPFPRKMDSGAAVWLTISRFLGYPQKVISARMVLTFSPHDFFKRFVGRVKITFSFRTKESPRGIYLVRFFPQKNNATVPGPVWLPMVVPTL